MPAAAELLLRLVCAAARQRARAVADCGGQQYSPAGASRQGAAESKEEAAAWKREAAALIRQAEASKRGAAGQLSSTLAAGAAAGSLRRLRLVVTDLMPFTCGAWLPQMRSVQTLVLDRGFDESQLIIDQPLAALSQLHDLWLSADKGCLSIAPAAALPTSLTRLALRVYAGESLPQQVRRARRPACAELPACRRALYSIAQRHAAARPPSCSVNASPPYPPAAAAAVPAVAAARAEPPPVQLFSRGLRPAGGAARAATTGAGRRRRGPRVPLQPDRPSGGWVHSLKRRNP